MQYLFFVKLKIIKIYFSSFIRHSKLLPSTRAYKSVYFCCLFPFFKNINEVVANIISTKIANCFSSTIATTRIAAAHMIELEINNFLLILCRQFYLLHRNGVVWVVEVRNIHFYFIKYIKTKITTIEMKR